VTKAADSMPLSEMSSRVVNLKNWYKDILYNVCVLSVCE